MAAPHDGVGGGWNVAVPPVWPVCACWMVVGVHVDPLWECDGVEVTDTCMLVALPP